MIERTLPGHWPMKPLENPERYARWQSLARMNPPRGIPAAQPAPSGYAQDGIFYGVNAEADPRLLDGCERAHQRQLESGRDGCKQNHRDASLSLAPDAGISTGHSTFYGGDGSVADRSSEQTGPVTVASTLHGASPTGRIPSSGTERAGSTYHNTPDTSGKGISR